MQRHRESTGREGEREKGGETWGERGEGGQQEVEERDLEEIEFLQKI